MANDDLKQKVFILNVMATPLLNSFLKLITRDQQKEKYILQFASFTMGEWFDPPLRKEFGLIIIHIYINHKTLCAQVFYISSAGKFCQFNFLCTMKLVHLKTVDYINFKIYL